MKLITNRSELEREFLSFLDQFSHYYWASAWAGINSNPFEKLKTNNLKIGRIVIGIHFYQTHPDFIKAFYDDDRIRYIMQPNGTFHPKLYLFENSENDWALILGSGNFTFSAFNENTEASVLITSQDDNAPNIYRNAKTFVETTWSEGTVFGKKSLEDYIKKWHLYRNKLKAASGEYGGQAKKKTPPHEIPIMNWTWREYADQILAEKVHGVDGRLKMLAHVTEWLGSVSHFKDLETEQRKFIAGAPNTLHITGWGYFGSMKGNGLYVNRIIENNITISKALDQIPSTGEITQTEYEEFISLFQQAFLNTRLEDGNNMATSTRLLTMKRPDTFVCYDSENEAGLCKDFGLKKSGMNFTHYWDDIIMRIRDCEWYSRPHPMNSKEKGIRDARAAFLDSLYYRKEQTVTNES